MLLLILITRTLTHILLHLLHEHKAKTNYLTFYVLVVPCPSYDLTIWIYSSQSALLCSWVVNKRQIAVSSICFKVYKSKLFYLKITFYNNNAERSRRFVPFYFILASVLPPSRYFNELNTLWKWKLKKIWFKRV